MKSKNEIKYLAIDIISTWIVAIIFRLQESRKGIFAMWKLNKRRNKYKREFFCSSVHFACWLVAYSTQLQAGSNVRPCWVIQYIFHSPLWKEWNREYNNKIVCDEYFLSFCTWYRSGYTNKCSQYYMVNRLHILFVLKWHQFASEHSKWNRQSKKEIVSEAETR